MSKRRKPPVLAITDLGPESQLVRGEVEAMEVADPRSPNRTVRRARRVWVPDTLRSKGTINEGQYLACVRYLNSYECGVEGVSDRSGVFVDGVANHSGPGDAQLAALTDFRKASDAVGHLLASVLAWCVLGHGTLEGYAKMAGMNPMHAAGYLVAAIHRLQDCYGY